jgi:DNA-binding NarL/FixJ family response regulator
MALSVLIVDDHKLLREGLCAYFLKSGAVDVVGEAGTVTEMLIQVASLQPDVLLLDVKLPDGDGLDSIPRLRVLAPAMRVLVLTGMSSFTVIRKAIDMGISGFINKEESVSELLRAIQLVAEGKGYLCPDAAALLSAGFAPSSTDGSGMLLSEREVQVLRLVSEGKRSKEIAEQLGINVKTVETYRCRLMGKLGLGSTAELVRYAIRHGLCSA